MLLPCFSSILANGMIWAISLNWLPTAKPLNRPFAKAYPRKSPERSRPTFSIVETESRRQLASYLEQDCWGLLSKQSSQIPPRSQVEWLRTRPKEGARDGGLRDNPGQKTRMARSSRDKAAP